MPMTRRVKPEAIRKAFTKSSRVERRAHKVGYGKKCITTSDDMFPRLISKITPRDK
jgi:hypothetical protein